MRVMTWIFLSVNFLFDDNWFGTAADEIRFRRNDTDLQQLDVALVRKDQNNTSGYGDRRTRFRGHR